MSNRRRAQANAPGGSLADVFEDWNDKGHLSEREYLASQVFLTILRANHGSSDGLVNQISDKVDTSVRSLLWPPGGGAPMGPQEVMLQKLRQHERKLLHHLATYREKPRGSVVGWAVEQRGYSSRKTRTAFTVGLGVGVLRSVEELCLPPVA